MILPAPLTYFPHSCRTGYALQSPSGLSSGERSPAIGGRVVDADRLLEGDASPTRSAEEVDGAPKTQKTPISSPAAAVSDDLRAPSPARLKLDEVHTGTDPTPKSAGCCVVS